jgi:hypothetical protein
VTLRRLWLAALLGLTLGCAAAPSTPDDLARYLQVRRQYCVAEGGRWTTSNFCERQACGI